ncbi:cell division protein ZipA [Aliidiomarina celeris]|uniref:cell division protein ZipA n=1 Tax=Aliidiomarina celeris TaxID=2249428 RepID=UPI000DE97054|nr:cell division protein ZipA [Aliidiomarina celeris]
MEGMRTILIIAGLLFILGLLAHGLWTIRKNNRHSQQRQAQREAAMQRTDGFDEYGIGKVRTIKQGSDNAHSSSKPVTRDVDAVPTATTRSTKSKVNNSTAEAADADKRSRKTTRQPVRKEPTVQVEQLPMEFDTDHEEPSIAAADAMSNTDDEPQVGSLDGLRSDKRNEQEPSAWEQEPLVEEQEPSAFDQEPSAFDQEPSAFDQEPSAFDQKPSASDQEPSVPEQEVVTLFVSGDIQGAILLQTVTELGFKFGDMDIFHRHEDTSGKGPILFSMANMFNPGVFNLDEIETFATRGVALFMTLPLKSDGHKAFTMMYNAANKIADAMPRAAVLDGNRNPITKQSVQHTYQKIREFERRQHVAARQS